MTFCWVFLPKARCVSAWECRAHSRFAPSQWETVLLCNDVSHWRGASLKSAVECPISTFQEQWVAWLHMLLCEQIHYQMAFIMWIKVCGNFSKHTFMALLLVRQACSSNAICPFYRFNGIEYSCNRWIVIVLRFHSKISVFSFEIHTICICDVMTFIQPIHYNRNVFNFFEHWLKQVAQ